MASRSSRIFQKRKAKRKSELARRKASRKERRRALIVCEGSKTEPYYLNTLVHDLGLTTAEVDVCGECDSAPKKIVSYGKAKLENDPDFDLIMFVFDKDTHGTYHEAIQLIEGMRRKKENENRKIMAITSVPCFEIWFLFHFEKHTRPYSAGGGKSSCENLISVLRKKPGFNGYQKGKRDCFQELAGRIHKAKSNAASVLKQMQDTGAGLHDGNPSTLFHVLIEELEELAKDIRL